MGKYVWSCSLCLHKTKRKSNVIRHIRLIHGIDSRLFENKDTKNGLNDATEPSREYTKFCCNGCLYNTAKKYNLMRHLKSVHLPNEGQHQEEERHYNQEEFEEIMNRLKASVQLPSKDNPKMVKVMLVRPEKTEAKIREGYLKTLEILTRWFNPDVSILIRNSLKNTV